MSLAMYELAKNQSIQEKVRKEIKEVLDSVDGVISYDSIKKINYLEKIFQGFFLSFLKSISYK